jgi:glutamyl-Q tRNA(Asp) synthetase
MYVGRFAPTPSGPLHFGSLVSAVGSYCDARSKKGKWLIRIDDLDQERVAKDAHSNILHTLDSYALFWDDEPVYQSGQKHLYAHWREKLMKELDIYPCVCSRQTLRNHSTLNDGEWIYSGYCKTHSSQDKLIRSYRINLPNPCLITIDDVALGLITDDLSKSSGDFALFKPDGTPSYQLASILDDHYSGITHVVRGEDLILSSLRQAKLQQIIGHKTAKFLHLPVVRNRQGQKLSKQNKADSIKIKFASSTLFNALTFLSQSPPSELQTQNPIDIMDWAVANWTVSSVRYDERNIKAAVVTRSTHTQVD